MIITRPEFQHRIGSEVIGTYIDALNMNDAIYKIQQWNNDGGSRVVCLCNAHSSVTARSDPALADALAESDMVLPDGTPIAWMLRKKGFRQQPRIAGPDLMYKLCAENEGTASSIFLFGSSETTLASLANNLKREFPNLLIRGTLSPKFGIWTKAEEESYIDRINASGARLIFIGLGCPKQEIWMSANRRNIDGVMLGVGAAFDFHAGAIKRAPLLLQKSGLEWLHRLLSEPKRLWKRYFITNTSFIYLATRELFRESRL